MRSRGFTTTSQRTEHLLKKLPYIPTLPTTSNKKHSVPTTPDKTYIPPIPTSITTLKPVDLTAITIFKPQENITDTELLDYLKANPRIQGINLTNCYYITDKGLAGIKQHTEHLISFKMENNIHTTSKGFDFLKDCINLQQLKLARLDSIKTIPRLNNLSSLHTLELSTLRQLETIPEWDNPSLHNLTLYKLHKLKTIPKWNKLSSLRTLTLSMLCKLKTIPEWSKLSSLQAVELSILPHVETIPSWSNLSSLKEIFLIDLPKLKVILEWDGLYNLKKLKLEILELEKIPEVHKLPAIQELNLEMLPCIKTTTDLKQLCSFLKKCEHLTSLSVGLYDFSTKDAEMLKQTLPKIKID